MEHTSRNVCRHKPLRFPPARWHVPDMHRHTHHNGYTSSCASPPRLPDAVASHRSGRPLHRAPDHRPDSERPQSQWTILPKILCGYLPYSTTTSAGQAGHRPWNRNGSRYTDPFAVLLAASYNPLYIEVINNSFIADMNILCNHFNEYIFFPSRDIIPDKQNDSDQLSPCDYLPYPTFLAEHAILKIWLNV